METALLCEKGAHSSTERESIPRVSCTPRIHPLQFEESDQITYLFFCLTHCHIGALDNVIMAGLVIDEQHHADIRREWYSSVVVALLFC